MILVVIASKIYRYELGTLGFMTPTDLYGIAIGFYCRQLRIVLLRH
jgi:hypothetical protein